MTIPLLTLADIDPNWQTRWTLGPLMSLPVDRIFIHHTVSRDTGDIKRDVGGVNDYDQKTFGKISYSWIVHPSTGQWVENEGVHRGAHTINNANQSLNGVSFGIGVIGNYQPTVNAPPFTPVTPELLELIAGGINEHVRPHLTPVFNIDGHRDVYSTSCPGQALYDQLPIIRSLVTSPTPAPEPEEDMITYRIKHKNHPEVFLVSPVAVRHIGIAENTLLDKVGVEMIETGDEAEYSRLYNAAQS